MEEYDKMLAGEYHYPFKDGVPNEYMKKLQEKARIDLENITLFQIQTISQNWLA